MASAGACKRHQPSIPFKFVGGPAKILSARFDITAKAPEGATRSQSELMLRTLLAERFALRIHSETRQTPVYAITVAREGRLGPNMRPSKYDCVALFTAGQTMLKADEETRAICWARADFNQVRSGAMTNVYAGPITQLARLLQGYVDRPMIDATGLTGFFESTITFAMNPFGKEDVSSQPLTNSSASSWRHAPLPLKLFVIDSVERPTPD